MPIYELDGQAPEFPGDGQYWVAETATLIGRVRLKREASVWFGAVLRGDNEWIELGERSQIQDNATLHTDPGLPLVIGSNCVIGHNVILHGCIDWRQQPYRHGRDRAQRRQDREKLPGRRRRVVTEGKTFPDNSLIVGAPARAVRTARRKVGRDDPRRRRHLRGALAAIRQGPEADRLGGDLGALDLRRGTQRYRDPVAGVDGGDRGG